MAAASVGRQGTGVGLRWRACRMLGLTRLCQACRLLLPLISLLWVLRSEVSLARWGHLPANGAAGWESEWASEPSSAVV